jgi:hypothetical protein
MKKIKIKEDFISNHDNIINLDDYYSKNSIYLKDNEVTKEDLIIWRNEKALEEINKLHNFILSKSDVNYELIVSLNLAMSLYYELTEDFSQLLIDEIELLSENKDKDGNNYLEYCLTRDPGGAKYGISARNMAKEFIISNNEIVALPESLKIDGPYSGLVPLCFIKGWSNSYEKLCAILFDVCKNYYHKIVPLAFLLANFFEINDKEKYYALKELILENK